jgi:hypothetical protein
MQTAGRVRQATTQAGAGLFCTQQSPGAAAGWERANSVARRSLWERCAGPVCYRNGAVPASPATGLEIAE